jgi:cytochrome c biogenesis protein CcdA
MLPLTVAYFSAEARSSQLDGDLSDSAPPRDYLFALSICFALGLSVALAAIGVSAALAGQVFGSFFSNSGQILRLASGSFAAVGGLSLLEVIDIEMPSFGSSYSLGNQANVEAASSTNLERFIRSFAFGASSALVSSTCSTPILASLLGNVASSSDSSLGAALLFCYTAGATYFLYYLPCPTNHQTFVLMLHETPYTICSGLATPVVAASALGVGATLGANGDRLSEITTPVLASFLIAYGVYSGLDAVFTA